jgi:hypothetical protein
MRLTRGLLALALAPVFAADAQDPMRGLDLTSPDMTTAEMTRAQVEAALKMAPGGRGADFAGKRLSACQHPRGRRVSLIAEFFRSVRDVVALRGTLVIRTTFAH